MNSVGFVQPSGYNRAFNGDLSISGGGNQNNVENGIEFCSETIESQAQGHSKWKINKKPKLRKKSNDGHSATDASNCNLSNGNDSR